MKTSLLQKGVGAAVALCAVAGAAALAPPAQATPYTGNNIVVTAAGSDTTQNFMTAYLARYNNKTTVVAGKTVYTYNAPSFPTTAFTTFGDKDCIQDISWTQAATTGLANRQAPSGSGAGLDFLVGQNAEAATQKGCVDIARSSGGPSSIAGRPSRYTSTQEFYAFAMDAVTWSSPSLKAPSTLTRQEVQDIYACNITDWSQVGGTSGPIQRYLPQSASGTRSFFLEQYGVTAGMLATVVPGSCPAVKDNAVANPAGGAAIKFEENQGKTIESVDIDRAILPYSAGVWSYQAANSANPTLDTRNGVRLGGLTTITGPVKGNPVEWVATDRAYQLNFSSGGVVSEGNIKQANPAFSLTNDYVGIRYVYNVLDNALGLDGYEAGAALVGFDNIAAGDKSDLCANDGAASGEAYARALVLSQGFAPLDSAANPLASNNAASTCRVFTNPA